MFKGKNITRFSKNFMWLFAWSNLAYIFSFLTIPILISKYGHQEVGVVFTTQAIILALSAIANYSFTFYIPTQSKKISTNEKFRNNLWDIIVSIRFLLSILLAIISICIIYIYFYKYITLWLLSLPILFAKIINPTLICNAIEKNQVILKIGFFSKFIFLVLIYYNNQSILINLFFGLSEFLVVMFFLPKVNLSILQIKFIGYKEIIISLKATFNLFLVSFFSLLKPASILPTISYILGSEYATYYTLAEKIINVVRGVSGAVFVSFFPIYNKEKIQLKLLSSKNIILTTVVSVFLVIVVWFLSPYLIYYLNDFRYNSIATKTLQILSLSIPMFFIVIPLFSYLLENQKWNAILYIAIIQLLVLFGLIFYNHQSVQQIAIAFVISEYVLLISYFTYILHLKRLQLKS